MTICCHLLKMENPARKSYCIVRRSKLLERRFKVNAEVAEAAAAAAAAPEEEKCSPATNSHAFARNLSSELQVDGNLLAIGRGRQQQPAAAQVCSSQSTAKLRARDCRRPPLTSTHYHSTTTTNSNSATRPPPPLLLLLLLVGLLALWPAAGQQYKPEWPNKAVEQEIFLLNLQDGYFGCQVNSSQDFLQLFELSRLCDGQPQCYLGSDELAHPLKCSQRDQCGLQTNSRGQPEPVQCVNGVCLDNLCYCNDGFGGKSCDIPDENECKFRPCDVFAHCTNTMGSYYCSCFPGYDGDGMHCQDINECEIPSLSALCADNSECVNLPGHFVCKCKPGYQQLGQSQSSLTGSPMGNATVQCTDIDECADERACGKGAICENLPGSFRCLCPAGFLGDPAVECIDMDECRNNPCGLGAQCTNIPGGFRCSCAPGFERNPNAPPNAIGTTLVQSSSQQQQQQLAGNLTQQVVACLDVNECQLAAVANKQLCGYNAQCINTPGGHFCQCPPNFTGNPKVGCVDVDECAAGACGPNAQCTNSPGSFKCECKSGFSGNAYSADGCQDEDECARKDSCGANAQCFNTLGSFQCVCSQGYAGDPYTRCLDVDECALSSACGPGAQCVNLDGGYKCACPDKFLARGAPEMGCERAAVDVDCSGDFDCTANAQCVNSTCRCKLGYQISGIHCIDVDECEATLLRPAQSQPVKAFTRLSSQQQQQQQLNSSAAETSICGPHASCLNTDGGYQCDCSTGYEKLEPNSTTSKCQDIDECAQGQRCGPNSKCFNTDGAFKCACTEGFIPVDENPASGCRSPCDGVSCGQHAACKPHGDEAACVCKPGFTFDPNNIKLGCVDINECDTNYGPAGLCGQRAICVNTPGAYRCHCPTGFAGDPYRYCEDINECDRKFGVFGQCGELALCTNKPGGFNCACAPGYQGDPRVKCTDVDECAAKFGPSGKCGQNAICTNTQGGFSCACAPNYIGDPNLACTPELPVCSSNADCAPNQLCQSGRCECPFATAANSTHCQHPCERTQCGANASCRLADDQQPVCVCHSGFMAPNEGQTSGCVDINECVQGATTLTGTSPLTVPTGGAIALGLAQVGPTHNGSHPCGRNALCRNQPGTFDCVCPPGYVGNAYESCQLDVRSQQTSTSPLGGLTGAITTTTTTTKTFGNYQQQQQQQQEQRTSGCSSSAACASGHICSEGTCVRPDVCRENSDCPLAMSCDYVNQLLGFQCINVCDLASNICGPGARCQPRDHKPVCSCNGTAAEFADPYDRINGCRLRDQTTDQQRATTSSMNTGDVFQQQVTKVADGASYQPTSSTAAKQSDGQQQGDLHLVTAPVTSQHNSLSSTTLADTLEFGLDRQQQQQANKQSQQTRFNATTSKQPEQPKQRPNQPLIAYELPLPMTTPILSQFHSDADQTTGDVSKTTSSVASTGPIFGFSTQSVGQQTTQPAQLFGLDVEEAGKSREQQQHSAMQMLDVSTTTRPQLPTTTQNLFSTKRKPQPTMISGAQKQQQSQFGGQKQDELSRNDETSSFDQFSNKSSIGTKQTQTNDHQVAMKHKQVACTSDQHCPGNLFCLPSGQEFEFSRNSVGQKHCDCLAGYRRESDFCYLVRTACNSPLNCRPREECVPSANATSGQQQLTATTISQQFALGLDEQQAAGICICPRGYKLTGSGGACVDRNECDEGTPCALGAICQNKVGSYECVCPPGTAGDPYTKTCEPLTRDECRSSADCADERECDLATGRCISPCHVCGPRAICTAAHHVAMCLCPPKFTGNAIDKIYGCQEPPAHQQLPPTTTTTSQNVAATTTTQRPSQQLQQTSTLGTPTATLLPSINSTSLQVTTSSPGGTTPESVEFRTIPPSELFVMCLADGIQVEMQLGGFEGIIYVKGHSQDPKCRKLVSSSSPSEFVDFKVQFGHCDLIHRDGEAGFVLVIQKHPKLVTYRARAYHVKCVYNTGERTVTLGFNVSMITTSGTIANTGPPPTCLMSIASLDGREVTSAEIGQDLQLRVDVQPDSIYGGFARSCEAKTMDDEGEYQYEVTDANGCATDPSIFSNWQYDQDRKSLVARFNAFKFPSSNNLRFQCNIRVCFGSCPAVNCNGIDAYGKKRRRRDVAPVGRQLGRNASNNLTEYHENEPDADELIISDTFKEGALREEIMVQSNAILTFDKKEVASLAQHQQKNPVEDIELICLPHIGIIVSVALTTLLALIAFAIATSCWCFAKKSSGTARHRQSNVKTPLPHPMGFPNPLLHSPSASTLYGP